jgi:hypothetical protein
MSLYTIKTLEDVEHVSNRMEFLGEDESGGKRIGRYMITTAYKNKEMSEEFFFELDAEDDLEQLVKKHKNLVQSRFEEIKEEMIYALSRSSLIPVCLVCINKELMKKIV